MSLRNAAGSYKRAELAVGMTAGGASELPLLGDRPVLLAGIATMRQLRFWAVFIVVALLLGSAVSNQSFWIDEANAAWRAAEPSFARFLQTMRADDGSDAQMPLFLVSLWGWEKVVGQGEWPLRAMNLLWFLPGLYFFANGRIERLLVAGASAFVWFYLDEARPYGMQLGTSLLVFGLFERAILAGSASEADRPLLRPHEAWLLVLGLIGLAGSSLLGAIWSGAAICGGGLAVKWRRRQVLTPALAGPQSLLVMAMAALAGYYAWTLYHGARGTAVAGTHAATLLFAIYELLGLAGLGSGRTGLRVEGIVAFIPYLVPLSLACAASVALAGIGASHILKKLSYRIILAVLLAACAAAALIVIAGYLVHWRVVGRHLAPILPLVMAVQAAGLAVAWRRPVGKVVVVAFLVLGLASAAAIRFATRHAKDDYRSAAAAAQAALVLGKKVWWNADKFGALIYGLQLGDGCDEVTMLFNPEKGFADHLTAPALVILSKPDIYDANSALATYLEKNHFVHVAQFMAFDVLRNPAPQPSRGCPPASGTSK